MQKKILSLFTALFFMAPLAAFAQLEPYAPGAPQISSLSSIVHSIEMAAGLVFGAVAVISFLIAGILFLTASGSPEKLNQARNAFFWGVGGVVVGIAAFSIIAIVGSIIK